MKPPLARTLARYLQQRAAVVRHIRAALADLEAATEYDGEAEGTTGAESEEARERMRERLFRAGAWLGLALEVAGETGEEGEETGE